jgi:hypothetical protein
VLASQWPEPYGRVSNLWPPDRMRPMKHFHPAREINKGHILIYMKNVLSTICHSVNFKPLSLNMALHLYLSKPMWPTDKKGWTPRPYGITFYIVHVLFRIGYICFNAL